MPNIEVTNGSLPYQFIQAEIEDIEKTHNMKVKEIKFTILNDDEVQEEYKLIPVPFERLRRITGYLSPVNRWNQAKKSELSDRVPHGR